jgi:hypothetical protein
VHSSRRWRTAGAAGHDTSCVEHALVKGTEQVGLAVLNLHLGSEPASSFPAVAVKPKMATIQYGSRIATHCQGRQTPQACCTSFALNPSCLIPGGTFTVLWGLQVGLFSQQQEVLLFTQVLNIWQSECSTPCIAGEAINALQHTATSHNACTSWICVTPDGFPASTAHAALSVVVAMGMHIVGKSAALQPSRSSARCWLEAHCVFADMVPCVLYVPYVHRFSSCRRAGIKQEASCRSHMIPRNGRPALG